MTSPLNNAETQSVKQEALDKKTRKNAERRKRKKANKKGGAMSKERGAEDGNEDVDDEEFTYVPLAEQEAALLEEK